MGKGSFVTYLAAPALYGRMIVDRELPNGNLCCEVEPDRAGAREFYEFHPQELEETN